MEFKIKVTLEKFKKYHLKNDNFIYIESSKNSGQKIIYSIIDKTLLFFDNENTCKIIRGEVVAEAFLNKDEIIKFANSCIEFCEENKCSLIQYLKENVYRILNFKRGINKYIESRSEEQFLHMFFDDDYKTAFAYHNGGIMYFTAVKNGGTCVYGDTYDCISNEIPKSSIGQQIGDSEEKFKYFIKVNRKIIDDIICKDKEQYKKQQEKFSKELTGATSTLAYHSREIK